MEQLTVAGTKKLLDEFYVEKFGIVEEIIKENETLEEKIERLEETVDELASYSRCNNVVIRDGVPIQKEESPGDLAIALCATVGVRLQPQEIDTARRMPTRNPNLREPFIIKPGSRLKKEEIIQMAKKKKRSDAAPRSTGNQKIYYNDHLTCKNLVIWKQAKTLRGAHLLSIRNRKVWCRSEEPGSTGQVIKCIEDVEKIEGRNTKKRTIQERSPQSEPEQNKKPQNEPKTGNQRDSPRTRLEQYGFERQNTLSQPTD